MLPCCIKATVDNPFTTRVSVNKYTGNTATVFYTEKGAGIVKKCAVIEYPKSEIGIYQAA